MNRNSVAVALVAVGLYVYSATAQRANASGDIPVVEIRTEPGHKVLAIEWRTIPGESRAKIWIQTRPADPSEEFGSIMETHYDPDTGKVIRKFLVIEQKGPDAPAAEDEDSEAEEHPASHS